MHPTASRINHSQALINNMIVFAEQRQGSEFCVCVCVCKISVI